MTTPKYAPSITCDAVTGMKNNDEPEQEVLSLGIVWPCFMGTLQDALGRPPHVGSVSCVAAHEAPARRHETCTAILK